MIPFDTIPDLVPSDCGGLHMGRRQGKAKRNRIAWWRQHQDARKRRREPHPNRRLRECKRDVRAAWRKLMDEHSFGAVVGSDFARTASKAVFTAVKRHMGMPRVRVEIEPKDDGFDMIGVIE